jgi:hypothetical protein
MSNLCLRVIGNVKSSKSPSHPSASRSNNDIFDILLETFSTTYHDKPNDPRTNPDLTTLTFVERMERPRISFGDPADSDGDRPVKRPRTALLNQLGSATPPAISFGTVSFEKKPTGLDFSSTPTNRPLFGTLGLSNSTTFTSIFGAANLGTPPLPEQQPGQFNTKSGTEMPIPDTTTSHSRPETPAASNSLFTDASLALGPFPGAKTSTFVSPPAGLRMEDLLFKRDEAAIMQEAEDIVKQEPQQESGLKNTVGTVQLKTEELAVIAPTESFDDHGDLTLVVGEAQTRFLVCSHSLRRVSTTWHDRLYGVSSNPKDREGANGWVVRLPEGNPEAMRIILRVVHSDLSKMPAAVSRRLLCHLTFLCDKHDMLSILKPFWAGWVGKLANPSVQPTGLRHEVWVAHKLGHLVWYKHILLQLLSLTHKRPNGRLFLASHADADLYKEPHLLQPVFLSKCCVVTDTGMITYIS